MSNSLFDKLKWLAIIGMPALATAYATIAAIWGLPFGDEVPKTIMAIATLLGAWLGVSTIHYKKNLEESMFTLESMNELSENMGDEHE